MNYKTNVFILSFFIISACSPAEPTVTPEPATALPEPTAVSTVDQDALLSELVTAINGNQVAEVEGLLASGVDLNVLAKNRLTPLSLAASKGHEEIVILLLEGGADVNMTNSNSYGTAPLIEAAGAGHLEILSLLLDAGADVNQQDRYGDPALNWATYYGHTEIVRLLLEQGADITVVGSGGGTALQTAIKQNHPEIEQLLRDAGATE